MRVRRSLRPSSSCTAVGCSSAPGGSWLRAGAVLVVVPFVGGQDLLGVGLAHDEDMVEDLAPARLYVSAGLTDRFRMKSLWWFGSWVLGRQDLLGVCRPCA